MQVLRSRSTTKEISVGEDHHLGLPFEAVGLALRRAG